MLRFPAQARRDACKYRTQHIRTVRDWLHTRSSSRVSRAMTLKTLGLRRHYDWTTAQLLGTDPPPT